MQASKRLARQQETKNWICEAAFHLYHHQGIEGVSMRTIGNLLGVSQMMSYRYFKSKNDLLIEMRARVIKYFADYLGHLASGKAKNEIKLYRILFGYLHYSEVASEDYRFAFLMNRQMMSRLNRDFATLFSSGQKNALDIHGNLIAQILNKPTSSKQVQFLTRYIWCSLHGLATSNLDSMLLGKPGYVDIKTSYIKQLLSGIIDADTLAKLRKPKDYPEMKPLVSPSENFAEPQ